MSARPPFDVGTRFELGRSLGEGGMGVVFEAYDREREELVALKKMRSVDPRALTRFKREFRALHDLSHRNVVTLGELFDSGSGPFFTMELIRGVDFVEYVRGPDGGDASPDGAPKYDEARLRDALEQLARAVNAIHTAGLVHRDIKPPNVLVTREGRVVLLDFGLATYSSSPTGPTQTSQFTAVGTAAYMAPEQALSGDVGPAADWYAVGVLLFEALTGTLPHAGRTAFDLILNKQGKAAVPPRQLVTTVPRDLDALCVGLLQTDATNRLGTREIFERLGIDHRAASADILGSDTSPSAATTFVGRADELRTLRAVYERSRQRPIAVFVEGVSGVGKTQLVESFLEELAVADPAPVVLPGRCYEREVVSYKAFDGIATSLARHLARLPRVQVAGLMPMHATLLARLFPALRRVEAIAAAPRVPEAPDPHDQRRRMFGALRELFLRMAERRPLILFVDDLQWTDADSSILFQDLLGGEDPPPLLLIATMRPVDDEARRSVVRGIEELLPTERILLDELSPCEARTLAKLLLPDKDAAVHDAVASDAGGHPLLLHALARHLHSSDDATVTGASLEEMIAARIDRLHPHGRTLLEVVALYGGPVTIDVACRAAELPHGEQAKATRALRAAHLLRTDGVRLKDRIVTYHDRVREYVAGSLDDERRKYVHERIALALAQTDSADSDPRALVHHARAAGQLDRAREHAVTAARRAMESLAFDQAAELFAIAIDIGSYDDATLRALRLDLASALTHAGRGPEAASVLMLAADDADPAVRLDCQRLAAEQWINTGHLDKGMDVLRASLAEIGEPLAATPRRALARVLWNRLRIRLRGTSYRRRVESQIAVATLRRLDVLRTVAHGLAMVDFIRGADFNGRFALLALRTGESQRLAEALATEVVYLASQGGRADRRARRVFARMKELIDEDPDDAYARGWLMMADGAAKFFEGRLAAADEALAECEALLSSRTTGTTAERNNARVFRMLATRHLGSWRRCRALAADAIRSGQQRGDRYLETTARLLRAPSLLASDEVSAARPNDDMVLWSPPEHNYHVQHYYQYAARVDIALYEGSVRDQLAALTDSFEQLRASMVFRVQMVRAIAFALHGRLCLAAHVDSGEPAQLARAKQMARALARERFGCADVSAHLLRAGLAPRGSDEAITHLRQAIEKADRLDMALHAAAARDRLGALVGGSEGAELRAGAARYAADEGIVRPERMFEAAAPGVLTSSD